MNIYIQYLTVKRKGLIYNTGHSIQYYLWFGKLLKHVESPPARIKAMNILSWGRRGRKSAAATTNILPLRIF